MTQKITAIFGIAVLAAILLGGLTFSQSALAGQSGGGGQQKVTLCHVDQETGEEITITVGAPAVPAHLAHGDLLGPCVEEPEPGCVTNDECLSEEYCAKPVGADPSSEGVCEGADPSSEGVCEVRPEICLPFEDPVCGVDAVTYSNDCFAAAAGVNIDHEGACDNGPGTCEPQCFEEFDICLEVCDNGTDGLTSCEICSLELSECLGLCPDPA